MANSIGAVIDTENCSQPIKRREARSSGFDWARESAENGSRGSRSSSTREAVSRENSENVRGCQAEQSGSPCWAIGLADERSLWFTGNHGYPLIQIRMKAPFSILSRFSAFSGIHHVVLENVERGPNRILHKYIPSVWVTHGRGRFACFAYPSNSENS